MKQQITIHIGEFHAAREPTVIHTVLGSCVAVCLYDPVERIGGMNHILLPGSANLKRFNEPARYGVNAMELLINQILQLGGNRTRLLAKAFGGGHILSAISQENGMGRQNARFVARFLRTEQIPMVGGDMGGRNSREIYFHTNTGEVFLKRFNAEHSRKVAEQQLTHIRRVRSESEKPGEVTLFE